MSWRPSQGSATYTAVAEDGRGRLWSCNTSSTSCQISGLFCGRRYRVYAAGVDERCTGAKSNIEEIHTGGRSTRPRGSSLLTDTEGGKLPHTVTHAITLKQQCRAGPCRAGPGQLLSLTTLLDMLIVFHPRSSCCQL